VVGAANAQHRGVVGRPPVYAKAQEADVTESNHGPKADSPIDGPNSPSNFGVLAERVANFDRRLGELALSLEKTNVALDKATDAMGMLGKPRIALWLGAGTLICLVTGAMWNIAIVPIGERVRDDRVQIKEEIQSLRSDLSNKASKEDLNNKLFELIQKYKK
jgi:hypothetical protein